MSIWLSLDIEVNTGGKQLHNVTLFDENMTHNVVPMWQKAGIYDAIYNSAGMLASDVLPALEIGLNDMEKNGSGYRKLDPENDWGDYNSALDFLQSFVVACRNHPGATISVSK